MNRSEKGGAPTMSGERPGYEHMYIVMNAFISASHKFRLSKIPEQTGRLSTVQMGIDVSTY